MSDKAQRTEPPTQRRLQKAREEGQFPAARELVGALQFCVFVALLAWGAGAWFSGFEQMMRKLLASANEVEVGPILVTRLAWQIFLGNFGTFALCGMAIALATLAFRLVTTRFGLSLHLATPQLKRLDPLSRLRELPKQNASALIQALIVLPVFLWAAWTIAQEGLDAFMLLPLQRPETGLRVLANSVKELLWKAAGVFLVVGCIDLFRQLRRYRRDLSMTKQEIREEVKESEGNPQMKAKVRRLQRDRARRQMMKEIPTATAVIVNPTHYAVAIRYQLDSMAAPAVVAKGKNYLALRIRQKATEHQVPIVENPPLAQSLYKSVDVGQEIPPHLYRAVAEVLAYIFKLMKGRLPG